jgi:hypothetical protein
LKGKNPNERIIAKQTKIIASLEKINTDPPCLDFCSKDCKTGTKKKEIQEKGKCIVAL